MQSVGTDDNDGDASLRISCLSTAELQLSYNWPSIYRQGTYLNLIYLQLAVLHGVCGERAVFQVGRKRVDAHTKLPRQTSVLDGKAMTRNISTA